MHEQAQMMHNDGEDFPRDETDSAIADEVDRFYGMVLQAQSALK